MNEAPAEYPSEAQRQGAVAAHLTDEPSSTEDSGAATAQAATKDLKALGLESFEVVTIHRRELKGAPYNPRTMTDSQKRKLRSGLKRHGLVAPITWNVRTGNIVGGHQRMEQLDALAGTDDYELHVARIDVDSGREQELNVLLNSQHAMGEWDIEKLGDIFKDPKLELSGMGFDHVDVFRMFGNTPLMERAEELDQLAQRVRDAREKYSAIEGSNSDHLNTDFYLVIVFRDATQCSKFLEVTGFEDNRYQSGEEFAERLGVLDKIVPQTANAAAALAEPKKKKRQA